LNIPKRLLSMPSANPSTSVPLEPRQILLRAGLLLLVIGAVVGALVLSTRPAEPFVLAFDGPVGPPAGVRVPPGMVYIPGGPTQIGSEKGLPMEMPVFHTEIEPFFMDEHPVTVAQFRAFVDSTGYVTQAEVFGDAAVLNMETYAWVLLPGATWLYPQGPDGPAAADDHPVTQVSWNDAVAYARWAGRRLPTEFEWEHAARGATSAPHDYAWGNALFADGKPRANTWEGEFPFNNSGADGYLFTSPVGAYGKTPLGLTDMGGNVWEWTDSWYRSYTEWDAPFVANEQSERVQRGGSFLCNEGYCHGYRVSARSHSTPESSLFHVGFRTVMDLPG
jgi:formylglycine-generating enzyme